MQTDFSHQGKVSFLRVPVFGLGNEESFAQSSQELGLSYGRSTYGIQSQTQ